MFFKNKKDPKHAEALKIMGLEENATDEQVMEWIQASVAIRKSHQDALELVTTEEDEDAPVLTERISELVSENEQQASIIEEQAETIAELEKTPFERKQALQGKGKGIANVHGDDVYAAEGEDRITVLSALYDKFHNRHN